MFGIPKFFGWRGRSLNLAISSLGSLDFLYDIISPRKLEKKEKGNKN
jgi:hypothetical protein